MFPLHFVRAGEDDEKTNTLSVHQSGSFRVSLDISKAELFIFTELDPVQLPSELPLIKTPRSISTDELGRVLGPSGKSASG